MIILVKLEYIYIYNSKYLNYKFHHIEYHGRISIGLYTQKIYINYCKNFFFYCRIIYDIIGS